MAFEGRSDTGLQYGLADLDANRAKLAELMATGPEHIATTSDYVLWHDASSTTGPSFFVVVENPSLEPAICHYVPYRHFRLNPAQQAIEASSWELPILGGSDRVLKERIFYQELLGRADLVVSSDKQHQSGTRFWLGLIVGAKRHGCAGGLLTKGYKLERFDRDTWTYEWRKQSALDHGHRFFLQA